MTCGEEKPTCFYKDLQIWLRQKCTFQLGLIRRSKRNFRNILICMLTKCVIQRNVMGDEPVLHAHAEKWAVQPLLIAAPEHVVGCDQQTRLRSHDRLTHLDEAGVFQGEGKQSPEWLESSSGDLDLDSWRIIFISTFTHLIRLDLKVELRLSVAENCTVCWTVLEVRHYKNNAF